MIIHLKKIKMDEIFVDIIILPMLCYFKLFQAYLSLL
jgi:hypothetical protein